MIGVGNIYGAQEAQNMQYGNQYAGSIAQVQTPKEDSFNIQPYTCKTKDDAGAKIATLGTAALIVGALVMLAKGKGKGGKKLLDLFKRKPKVVVEGAEEATKKSSFLSSLFNFGKKAEKGEKDIFESPKVVKPTVESIKPKIIFPTETPEARVTTGKPIIDITHLQKPKMPLLPEKTQGPQVNQALVPVETQSLTGTIALLPEETQSSKVNQALLDAARKYPGATGRPTVFTESPIVNGIKFLPQPTQSEVDATKLNPEYLLKQVQEKAKEAQSIANQIQNRIPQVTLDKLNELKSQLG